MSEVKYSKEHEWIKLEGDVATIGITQHATEMLGDIVFVELPEVGSSVEKDGNAGVVESTKAASDVYTPVSGEVVENNQAIVDDPGKVNSDPENDAWFFKLKIKDKIEYFKKQKETAQPSKIKTGGSTFKNPDSKIKAWELIQKSGCDKKKFGKAKFSKKHCNFFINKGKAKSLDIENLIKKVKNKVYEKTKINLELEIKIVGE